MGLNWVWCGICAKYLAFGTYPTSAVGALIVFHTKVTTSFLKLRVWTTQL